MFPYSELRPQSTICVPHIVALISASINLPGGPPRLTHILALQGVSDPEKKRKAIGAAFIDVFNNFAKGLEEKGGIKPSFLVQGTLYPDVIESCPPPGSKQKHSHTIKSHHNVGGLPKDLQFKLIEPLRELFKVTVLCSNSCSQLALGSLAAVS